MSNLASILRRQMKAPLFALTVVVLIGAAVMINTTAFTALYAVVWKALPYKQPDRLVDLRENLQKFGLVNGLDPILFERVAADHRSFAGAIGFTESHARDDLDSRTWKIAAVSPGFDRVLGINPMLGRTFAGTDVQDDDSLVLSSNAWKRYFGGGADVIGKRVRFADRSYTVIGVMPPDFMFPDATFDAWSRYRATPAEIASTQAGMSGGLDVLARLAPGISADQARESLARLIDSSVHLKPLGEQLGLKGEVRPWRERFVQSSERALVLLQLAALILLAVTTANLVNLYLDHWTARARELDIRRALGASGRAIGWMAIAETVPIVAVGLLAGLLMTPLGIYWIRTHDLLPKGLPGVQSFTAAPLVVGFVIGICMLAAGAGAALAARRASTLSMRGNAGIGRLRPVLIAAQVMLTVALLGNSGLLLKSALKLGEVRPGFDPKGVVLTALDPPPGDLLGTDYDLKSDPRHVLPLLRELRDATRALPGVSAVAITDAPPFGGVRTRASVPVPGQQDKQQVRWIRVSPDYFRALGIQFRQGSDFASTEVENQNNSAPVIVDQTYRERYLAHKNPIGASAPFVRGSTEPLAGHVIGVVQPTRQQSLADDRYPPTIYTPSPAPLPNIWLVTRSSRDPAALALDVAKLVHARAPDWNILVNRPLQRLIDDSLVSRNALLQAIGAFAVATLALAVLGLAAVLSLATRRRAGEIGVRMALGATRQRVVLLIISQGGRLVLLGAIAGVAIGLVLARAHADQLYATPYTDALTWLACVVVVTVAGALACWLPARHAAAIDPIAALRSE
ncbi:MAG: ABC transporter permease [Rhodanobacteraceae bacterium]